MEATIAIDFFNVGFGQAIVAYPTVEKFPALVIDGGDDRPEVYTSSTHAVTLYEHLRCAGITEIDLMIATHPHRDHIGGLKEVVEQMPVHRFITFFDMPPAGQLADEGNMGSALKLYSELLGVLKKKRQCERDNTAGLRLLSESANFECGKIKILVYPPGNRSLLDQARVLIGGYCEDKTPDKLDKLSGMLNAVCMTLRLDVNGRKIFLPCDAPLSQWDSIQDDLLSADIMSVAHHGDAACLSRSLLGKIGAQYAVICADAKGTYGLPQPECIEMLRACVAEDVLFTAGGLSKESARGVRLNIAPSGSVKWEHI